MAFEEFMAGECKGVVFKFLHELAPHCLYSLFTKISKVFSYSLHNTKTDLRLAIGLVKWYIKILRSTEEIPKCPKICQKTSKDCSSENCFFQNYLFDIFEITVDLDLKQLNFYFSFASNWEKSPKLWNFKSQKLMMPLLTLLSRELSVHQLFTERLRISWWRKSSTGAAKISSHPL